MSISAKLPVRVTMASTLMVCVFLLLLGSLPLEAKRISSNKLLYRIVPYNNASNVIDDLNITINNNCQTKRTYSLKSLVHDAVADAISDGKYGAMAGIIQVFLMMWVRTVTHYQHRYGLNAFETIQKLYSEGGIPRFYKGISYAIIQAPLSRFGSIASNSAAKRLSTLIKDQKYSMMMTTSLGTVFASIWRLLIVPIDTCKTVLQVEGRSGFHTLLQQVCHNIYIYPS